jgi:hypothetical protein
MTKSQQLLKIGLVCCECCAKWYFLVSEQIIWQAQSSGNEASDLCCAVKIYTVPGFEITGFKDV